MPLQVGSTPPASIMQGDTLSWRAAYADAQPSEVTALRVRVSSSTHTVEVTAVADGPDWLITVPAADTQRLGAGLLKWLARATYTSGAVQTVAAGQLTAVSVSALGTGANTASHAARMVALLEAQLEKLAADSLEQYSVGERSATRRKMEEVERSLTKARRHLAMEQNGGRLPSVVMRFPPLVGIDTAGTGGVG